MRSFSRKTLSILISVYKMENNYETLRMTELKALARGRRLRGHSRLRKVNKRIENKIAELNKKIRRVKNKKNKERLIAKRNSLRFGPKELEGAFSGA